MSFALKDVGRRHAAACAVGARSLMSRLISPGVSGRRFSPTATVISWAGPSMGSSRRTAMSEPPVPFEVYEAGTLLHGTKAQLPPGNLLMPGRPSNFESGRKIKHLYLVAKTKGSMSTFPPQGRGERQDRVCP